MRHMLLILLFLSGAAVTIAQTQPQEPRRLLAIVAHPDDELTIGPVLARYAREGVRIELVIATNGDQGANEDRGIAAGPELAAVRAREAACSAETLGFGPPVLVGLGDGDLDSDRALDSLATAVRREIRELRPQVILTWGPDGGSGHPDHRLVSAVVTQVFASGGPDWPTNLYYLGWSVERVEAWFADHAGDRVGPPIYGVEDRYLTVRVPYERRDEQTSRAAFQCHASQFTPALATLRSDQLAFFYEGAVTFRPFVHQTGRDLFGPNANAR